MVHNGEMRAAWQVLFGLVAVMVLGCTVWLALAKGTTLGNEIASIVSMLVAVGTALAWICQKLSSARASVDVTAYLRFTSNGKPPRAGEVAPVDLGVKQPLGTAQFGLTGYVGRDVDAVLAGLASRGGMVVLHGAATAGKTRAAAALLGAPLLARRSLLVPSAPEALRALLDEGFTVRDAVVWLDDLERFLVPAGLDEALVERLCPPDRTDVAVVATIRQDELDALLDAETSSRQDRQSSGIQRPGARLIHQLKQNGRLIVLDKTLSGPERERAMTAQAQAQAGDTRIRDAVATAAGFGEYLIAGPAMLDHWANGDTPAAHLARAVISAAVDCRRAGFHLPIPARVLETLAPVYLPGPFRRADLPAIDQALSRASRPLAGTHTSSCLTPLAGNTYLAADYLLDQAGQPPSPLAAAPIGAATWHALLGLAGPEQQINIGLTAYYAGENTIAETALRGAADAGNTFAMFNLGVMLAEWGDPAGAEELYNRATDAGATDALNNLGVLLENRGDPAKAEELYNRAIGAGSAEGLCNLGVLLERRGDLAGAEEQYKRAIDAANADAMSNLGVLLGKRGDLAGAEEQYKRAIKAGSASAVNNLALLMERRGDLAKAEDLYNRAIEAGSTAALNNFGVMVERRGDLDRAEELFNRAIGAGDTNAMTNLGLLLVKRGELARAEQLHRRAADAGNVAALNNLGRLLARRSDLAGAEELYRRAADAGNADAINNLGVLVEHRGDLAGAEELYNRALDAGNTNAMTNLAVLTEKRGDPAGAEALYNRAIDAGDTNAMSNLGVLVENRGDADGAEKLYTRAADAGNTNAMTNLGALKEKRGDLAGAEELYRRAADAGNIGATYNLGVLLHRRGDLPKAEELYNLAAEAGHSRAMYNLGFLLHQRGDLGGAQNCWRRAAALGHPQAAHRLEGSN